MAAKHGWVTCPAGQWTEVTDAAGTTGNVSISLYSGGPVLVAANADGSTPGALTGHFPLLRPGDGWSEATIAEKFPGLTAPTHLLVYPQTDAVIAISHPA